jgi:hypothetical protein
MDNNLIIHLALTCKDKQIIWLNGLIMSLKN